MKVQKAKKKWAAMALAGAIGLLTLGTGVRAATPEPIFDWSVDDNSGNANYTPAPVLTDTTVNSVKAFLTARHNATPSAPLAIKIVTPISSSTAATIFNHFNVNYVFADFETASPDSDTGNLVKQIHAAGSLSTKALVGNFNLYPVTNDTTRGPAPSLHAKSFAVVFNKSDYLAAGVNMANPAAYPGSPDFETYVGNAPNIRSALFILPIDRVNFASIGAAGKTYSPAGTQITPGTYTNIPWITRFDNWGNSLYDNDNSVAGYPYAFNTTNSSDKLTYNQLLSRGDFSAQVLTYRLRGATSFNLFNYATPYASVIGYTQGQQQTDAFNGWNYKTGSSGTADMTLNSIFSRNNYAFANLTNNIPGATPGSERWSTVQAGLILSGIYDKSGTTRQLVLLLSNMGASSQIVDLWQKYGGASIDLNGKTSKLDEVYTIAPGTHRLLEFNLTGGKWDEFNDYQIFNDQNRAGIGVPEPTSIALLGLAGAGFLFRRRRASV